MLQRILFKLGPTSGARSSYYFSRKQLGSCRFLSSGMSTENKSSAPPLQGNEIYFFGPKDIRLPLPGDVGIPPSELQNGRRVYSYKSPLSENCRNLTEMDMYRVELSEDRQRKVFDILTDVNSGLQLLDVDQMLNPENAFHLLVQECPLLLKKDFQLLFPEQDILYQPLTIIVVSLRLDERDSDVSPYRSIQLDKDNLTDSFLRKARVIVQELKQAGYWANIINPLTVSYQIDGTFVTDAFFETNRRYQNLDLKIESRGFCKEISHREFGECAFVGCLFSNAPLHSACVQKILAGDGK